MARSEAGFGGSDTGSLAEADELGDGIDPEFLHLDHAEKTRSGLQAHREDEQREADGLDRRVGLEIRQPVNTPRPPSPSSPDTTKMV